MTFAPNKALQPTQKPLRDFSSAELGRYVQRPNDEIRE